MKLRLLHTVVFTIVFATVYGNQQQGGKEKELIYENYIPTQEILAKRMHWFEDARFGMFIHWGVYSPLSGTWNGVKYQGYGEHIQRMAKIPISEYKEKVVAAFNPSEFDAEKWVRLAKDAGMKYLVFTAKHHDGFAMYDSKISDFNIMKATPFGRDPMAELRDACKKAEIRFGVYYSQAFDWGEKDAPGNDWDYNNPGGDLLIGGMAWWESQKDFIPKAQSYVDKKVIPQLEEIINNYQPDLIWFDTPHKLPRYENLRILAAVRKLSPDIIINGRAVEECGDYANTWDRPANFFIREGYWEGIPTTNNSFAYNENDTIYKSASHFIQLLAKASAKGGNILMNIGPRGDGSIDTQDIKILQDISRWWKTNGEKSIRGTKRSPLSTQAWGESTLKGNTLYLHVFEMPQDGKLTVGGLLTKVKKAYLLNDTANNLKIHHFAKDLVVDVPKEEIGKSPDIVIALECTKTPLADKRRLLCTQTNDKLHVFDAQLSGKLQFGGEAERQSWVENWKNINDQITWLVRTNKEQTCQVYVNYSAPAPENNKFVEGDAGKEKKEKHRGASGRYNIFFGKEKLTREVISGEHTHDFIGEISLPKGEFNISVSAEKIIGDELFRLRSIELRIK